MLQFDKPTIDSFDIDERRRLMNQISGVRSAFLIGTQNTEGQNNLAIFNTIIHLGAKPPLLGFVLRPTTVPRHTYENIESQGFYSLNLCSAEYYKQAHTTSGSWSSSEFEASGLTATTHPDFENVPLVQESPLRMILQKKEELLIQSNGCRLIIGEIQWLEMTETALTEDKRIDHEAIDSLQVSGLDSYYRLSKIDTLGYVKGE